MTESRFDRSTSHRRRRLRGACALALACLVTASCGKKGPPLPPLVKLPIAPSEVTATRKGDRVIVRFTIPTRSQSGVLPPDIEWVEVYSWVPPVADPKASPAPSSGTGATGGAAGTQLLPAQIFKYAKLVGRVQVRKPPPPPPERKEGEPPPPPPPPPTGPGLDQGTAAEVVDTLGPADAEPIVIPRKTRKVREVEEREITLTPPDVGPPLPPLPARLYAVVGVSHHGKRGALSQPIRVPLWAAPPAPSDLVATVREGAVDLAWKAPDGVRRPLVLNLAPTPVATPRTTGRAGVGGTATPGVVPPGDAPQGAPGEVRRPRGDDEEDEEDAQVDREAEARREAAMAQAAQARAEAAKAAGQPAPVTPSAAAVPPVATTAVPPEVAGTLASRVPYPWPATAGGFNVYEVLPEGAAPPAGTPAPPAVQPLPKVLTPAPVKPPTFTDPRVEFGVSRCYVVRTAETVGLLSMESAASAPACISATDTFAPKPPKSLGAVSSGGAISLIWEANTEADLAGYLVLRAVNDGPLQAITPEPIKETTFRDTNVRPGSKYAYVVVAVDTAKPPNRSGESNRVEETVR